MKPVDAKSSVDHPACEMTGLPEWSKMFIKAIVSVPFTFHSFNGLRHLMWDLGYGESVVAISGSTQRSDTCSGYDRANPEGGICNWICRRRLDVCFEHRACDAVMKKQHPASVGPKRLQGQAYEIRHVTKMYPRGNILDELWKRMSNDWMPEVHYIFIHCCVSYARRVSDHKRKSSAADYRILMVFAP
jgi:hypothetical protein